MLLWKAVCSNKLLANVDLVLFLNKCDILDSKLSSGIRLSKYVRSYGDRPNDMETASRCQFADLSLRHSAADLFSQTSEASLARYIENTRRFHGNFMDFARLSR